MSSVPFSILLKIQSPAAMNTNTGTFTFLTVGISTGATYAIPIATDPLASMPAMLA